MQALKSLRVLDLSKVIAGPLCGQYLGHFGADVIKVEPLNGDDSRAWPPHKEGHGATYLTMNHNKRSLAVDLKSEDGIRLVHELVKSCDIVIQGFGSGAAERLRVDYDTLRAIKPDIIYCEISGYGRSGPLGTKPGYDVMAQAFSGMMASMGESDGGLVRASFSPVDQGTGMHAFASILVAVIERQRTGKGCYLEISLFATALHFMNYMAQAYWQTGKVPRKMGSAHGAIAPYQAFRTSDGNIMLGAGNDGQWQRLCQILGLAEAISDPRFATSASRVAHYSDTVALIQNQLLLKTSADWLEKFETAGLPCSIVNELDEALQHPQVEALGLVVETTHAKLGRVKQVAYPTSFAGSSRAENRTPPMLGEHSHEILAEVGIAPDQIESLVRAGIVGQAP